MEDRYHEFTLGTSLYSAVVLFALRVIAAQANAAQLCDDISNATSNTNCPNETAHFTSAADVTEPQNLTFTGKYATIGAGKPGIVTTTASLVTETMSVDALRFSLIGLVIALGILGVVVLIIIRRKSTIRYNKTRKQSIVQSSTDPDVKFYKYNPYYATVQNIPNGTVFSTKSSISERGQYGDDV